MKLDAKLTQKNPSFPTKSGETVVSQYGCQPLTLNQIYPTLTREVGANFLRSLNIRLLFYAPFAFFLLISPFAFGQRDTKKLRKAGVVQLNDTITSYGQ